MLGAGTLLGEFEQSGNRQHQDQQRRHHNGQHAALPLLVLIGPAQGEALFQKHNADADADGKADKAHQGVQVAAAQPQHHPQGAAQEGQRADHHKAAQHKPHGRGGTGPCPELPGGHGHDEGAQHQADDLRAEVLHLGSAVKSAGACNVPQEAGDAEAHVGGVAQQGQGNGRQAHGYTGGNDDDVFFLHRIIPLLLHILRRSGGPQAEGSGTISV